MQNAVTNNSRPVQTLAHQQPLSVPSPSAQGQHPFIFEDLQKTYSRRLFKQIIAITKHHEDAEDALQDTLYKAYVALPLFQRRCHIYTWLSRIAINCALAKIRKRTSLRELSIEKQNDWDENELTYDFPDKSWSAEVLYCATEQLLQIANIAESLDPISRQVLNLRANHDYSMDEIASQLGMSLAAVKARLYRARHVLRVLLPDNASLGSRN